MSAKKHFSNIDQLKAGAFLSFFQMALGSLVVLFYTPVMIRELGKSEYGLYNTVASTVSMLSILNLGLSSGYIRFYTRYNQKKDYDSIYRLNGIFLLIFTAIGCIAFLCGIFLSNNLKLVFSNGLTADEYSKAHILMLLMSVNLALTFPMSAFTSIISAHEKYIILKLLEMINNVFGPFITFPLLLMGYDSIAMVLVSLSIAIFTDIIYIFYVFYFLRQKFYFRGFKSAVFKSLFSYTIFIAINLIIDQINWNVDKLLLGRFRGTAEVAIYSAGFTLYSYYQLVSVAISSVFTPRIHRIVSSATEDSASIKTHLTSLFIKVGRIQFLILGLASTGILFFGKIFIIKYWAGNGYDSAYYVTLLLIFPASIALIQNLGIEIQRAQNLHHFRSYVYSGMALVNLILSVFLCRRYGPVGSAFGTAVSLILANGLVMNIYYHKKCNLDIVMFWKNILLMTKGLIIPVISGILINKFFKMTHITTFLCGILIYTLCYCISVWFLSMNKEEKNLVTKPLKRIVRRI